MNADARAIGVMRTILIAVMALVATLILAGCSDTPSTPTRQASVSVESSRLAEYVSDLTGIIGSVGAIRTDLVTVENYLDPATVTALAEKSQEFGDAFEAVLALNPPTEAQELHETVLEALVTCEESLLRAAQFMNGDGEHYLDESTEAARKCGELFRESTDLLEEVAS